MSDFNQIPHVCGFWALSCSNLNYVLILSFTYLNKNWPFPRKLGPKLAQNFKKEPALSYQAKLSKNEASYWFAFH